MPGDPTSGPLTLLLVAAGVATLVGLGRSWRSFWDAELTSADRRRAVQVAIFVIPPLAVLVHELGHVVAARVVGAEVVGFHYRFFEGSVTIVGRLGPLEDWLVAVAGSVVSVALGAAMVALGARTPAKGRAVACRPAARYTLIAGGLLGLAFALVGYPLISFAADFGDWLVVYDFSATPVASTLTAVVHVAAAVAVAGWWRSSGRLRLLTVAPEVADRVGRLQGAVGTRPSDPDAHLALAQAYCDLGSPPLARASLARAVAEGVEPARMHLARARLANSTGRWSEAVVAAREGLGAPGPEELRQRLRANLVVGLTKMQRWDLALEAIDGLGPGLAGDRRLRYCRGVALLGVGDTGAGRAQLGDLARSLPEGDLLRLWAEARLAGGEPVLADRGVPAHRRAPPPPEPLVGL